MFYVSLVQEREVLASQVRISWDMSVGLRALKASRKDSQRGGDDRAESIWLIRRIVPCCKAVMNCRVYSID
jgi:hypothetical protein